MKNKLNCRQVDALITFYKEGCLTELLTKYVKQHLDNCPSCRAKYNEEEVIMPSPQYEIFRENLSAYIDNELDDSENIKIKKIAISNQQARQDLEDMYNFKKTLNEVFEKTKSDFRTDYSRNIMKQINNTQTLDLSFYKLATAFAVMVVLLTAGLLKILYLH